MRTKATQVASASAFGGNAHVNRPLAHLSPTCTRSNAHDCPALAFSRANDCEIERFPRFFLRFVVGLNPFPSPLPSPAKSSLDPSAATIDNELPAEPSSASIDFRNLLLCRPEINFRLVRLLERVRAYKGCEFAWAVVKRGSGKVTVSYTLPDIFEEREALE